MRTPYEFAEMQLTRLSRLRRREANTLGVRSAYSLASLYCMNCGEIVCTQRITKVLQTRQLGGCRSAYDFSGHRTPRVLLPAMLTHPRQGAVGTKGWG